MDSDAMGVDLMDLDNDVGIVSNGKEEEDEGENSADESYRRRMDNHPSADELDQNNWSTIRRPGVFL